MSLEIPGQLPSSILAARSTSVIVVDPIKNAIAQWVEASTRAETKDREERLQDKKQVIRSFLKYVGTKS